MIEQLMSSLTAGKGGSAGKGGKGGSGGSIAIPMSSNATSSATSGAGSRNKRVNVNFSSKMGGDDEYEQSGAYFGSSSPVNYTAIALIGAIAIVAVFVVRK